MGYNYCRNCNYDPCRCERPVGKKCYPPSQGDTIPRGIIVMWSGTVNEIPDGWLLCDGTNGTPDLHDRFIMGTVIASEIGDTGGNASIQLTEAQLAPHSHTGNTDEAGEHSHTGNTDEAGEHSHTGNTNEAGEHIHTGITNVAGEHTHSGTTNQAGAHQHEYLIPVIVERPIYNIVLDANWTTTEGDFKQDLTSTAGIHSHTLNINPSGQHSHSLTIDPSGLHSHTLNTDLAGLHTHTLNTDLSGLHTHSITTNTVGNGEPIDILPPYYKLAFIMKA